MTENIEDNQNHGKEHEPQRNAIHVTIISTSGRWTRGVPLSITVGKLLDEALSHFAIVPAPTDRWFLAYGLTELNNATIIGDAGLPDNAEIDLDRQPGGGGRCGA